MAAFANIVGGHFFAALVARLRTMVWDDRAKEGKGRWMASRRSLTLVMQHNHITFNSTGSVTDADHVQINLSEAPLRV